MFFAICNLLTNNKYKLYYKNKLIFKIEEGDQKFKKTL